MSERVHGPAGADHCGPDEGVRPEDAEGTAGFHQQCIECDGRSEPQDRGSGVERARTGRRGCEKTARARLRFGPDSPLSWPGLTYRPDRYVIAVATKRSPEQV